MRQRPRTRLRPEATALEVRALLTSVTPLPLDPWAMLNNQGVSVGNLPQRHTNRPYFGYPGAPPTKVILPSGDTVGQVVALNDAGQVIGTSGRPGRISSARGFLSGPTGPATVIPTLPGFNLAVPQVLSSGGLVAGIDGKIQLKGRGVNVISAAPSSSGNFVYGKTIGLIDMGTLPGLPSLTPAAINDASGLVIGSATSVDPASSYLSRNPTHAFAYNVSSRQLLDLGTAQGFDSSAAKFVNAQGEISGTLSRSDVFASNYDVFVYTAASGLKDIGSPSGYDETSLLAELPDGRLFVQATNSQTLKSAAAMYQPGKGFVDVIDLPSQTDGSPSVTAPNQSGQALVTTQLNSRFQFFVLDLKSHKFTDITSQISDPSQYLLPAASTQINDQGQFLLRQYSDQDPALLVSLNASGPPYHGVVPHGGPKRGHASIGEKLHAKP